MWQLVPGAALPGHGAPGSLRATALHGQDQGPPKVERGKPQVIQVAWKSGFDWCLVSVSFEEPRIPSHEPHLSSRLSFSGSHSGGSVLRWGRGGPKLAGREALLLLPHGLWVVWAWNLCAIFSEGLPCLRVLRVAGTRPGLTTSIQAPALATLRCWLLLGGGHGASGVDMQLPTLATLTAVVTAQWGHISSCASFQKPPEDLFPNGQNMISGPCPSSEKV